VRRKSLIEGLDSRFPSFSARKHQAREIKSSRFTTVFGEIEPRAIFLAAEGGSRNMGQIAAIALIINILLPPSEKILL